MNYNIFYGMWLRIYEKGLHDGIQPAIGDEQSDRQIEALVAVLTRPRNHPLHAR